jgi:hypothetical protein
VGELAAGHGPRPPLHRAERTRTPTRRARRASQGQQQRWASSNTGGSSEDDRSDGDTATDSDTNADDNDNDTAVESQDAGLDGEDVYGHCHRRRKSGQWMGVVAHQRPKRQRGRTGILVLSEVRHAACSIA